MGFDLCYSTTEKISPALQAEIAADAKALAATRSWVRCDGPAVSDNDGCLFGSSRISPADPDGVAESEGSDLPIGGVSDLFRQLCELSGRHGIDWEIFHDHSDGVVGLIEYGVAEDAVQATFEGLAELMDGLDDIDDEMFPDDIDGLFG